MRNKKLKRGPEIFVSDLPLWEEQRIKVLRKTGKNLSNAKLLGLILRAVDEVEISNFISVN